MVNKVERDQVEGLLLGKLNEYSVIEIMEVHKRNQKFAEITSVCEVLDILGMLGKSLENVEKRVSLTAANSSAEVRIYKTLRNLKIQFHVSEE